MRHASSNLKTKIRTFSVKFLLCNVICFRYNKLAFRDEYHVTNIVGIKEN